MNLCTRYKLLCWFPQHTVWSLHEQAISLNRLWRQTDRPYKNECFLKQKYNYIYITIYMYVWRYIYMCVYIHIHTHTHIKHYIWFIWLVHIYSTVLQLDYGMFSPVCKMNWSFSEVKWPVSLYEFITYTEEKQYTLHTVPFTTVFYRQTHIHAH